MVAYERSYINTSFASHRQVTTEEAEAKASELNLMFIETSAKAGHNVKTLFKKIAQALPGMDKSAEGGEQANKSECGDSQIVQSIKGHCVFLTTLDFYPFPCLLQ